MILNCKHDKVTLHAPDHRLQLEFSPEPPLACGFAFGAPIPCCAGSPRSPARPAAAAPATATTFAAGWTAGVRLVRVV